MTRLVVKCTWGVEREETLVQAFTVAATAAASGIEVSMWLTGVSIKIPTYISLAVILSILAISVIASLIVTANRPAKLEIDEHGVHVKE